MSDSMQAVAAGFIRDQSRKGLVSSEKSVIEILTPDAADGFHVADLCGAVEYADIVRIKGKQKEYWYSNRYMTDNFAELSVMLEEKDLLELVVSTIRRDCRLYPRPTAVSAFRGAPYCLSDEELEAVLSVISSSEEYSDIGKCVTSVDTAYMFSAEFMPRAQAEYLSEWDAVGQYENQ